MACPICGRVLCDHTPEERGQTPAELNQDLFKEGERLKNRPATPQTWEKVWDACPQCGRVLCDCGDSMDR